MHTKMIAILTLFLFFPISVVFANPTGAPLLTYPVFPCRVFDTRVSLGPIPANTTFDIFVRGSSLPANYGARKSDCGIPTSAEAVIINVVAINPTTPGQLVLDGTGYLYTNSYSRLNYNIGQVNSNEMMVSLCNAATYPNPQLACTYNGSTLYADLQVWNNGAAPVHVLADVVGYLARQ